MHKHLEEPTPEMMKYINVVVFNTVPLVPISHNKGRRIVELEVKTEEEVKND